MEQYQKSRGYDNKPERKPKLPIRRLIGRYGVILCEEGTKAHYLMMTTDKALLNVVAEGIKLGNTTVRDVKAMNPHNTVEGLIYLMDFSWKNMGYHTWIDKRERKVRNNIEKCVGCSIKNERCLTCNDALYAFVEIPIRIEEPNRVIYIRP